MTYKYGQTKPKEPTLGKLTTWIMIDVGLVLMLWIIYKAGILMLHDKIIMNGM